MGIETTSEAWEDRNIAQNMPDWRQFHVNARLGFSR
jgi:hypothetical protein